MPEIIQYVIYDHPRDFPRHYVLRRWRVTRGGIKPDRIAALYNDIGSIRRDMENRGLGCIPRLIGDDPNIIEVWM